MRSLAPTTGAQPGNDAPEGLQRAVEIRVYDTTMGHNTMNASPGAALAQQPAWTLPDPSEQPDLDHLGDQIAELSARIQAATYELLCYLHDFDRHHGWEGFRSCAPRRAAQRG